MLGVLGNSMRGLSCMAWRHIFSSIILPILTYGSNVWFTDVNQKSYLQVLQVAQNEACRKLTGVFRTTPTHLVQKLLAIPPIRFRLRHLLRTAHTRLATLPPSCAIHSPQLHRKAASPPPFIEIDPPLAEISNPLPPGHMPFAPPPPPFAPQWSHPRYDFPPISRNNNTATKQLLSLKTKPIKRTQSPHREQPPELPPLALPSPDPIKILIATPPFTFSPRYLATFSIFSCNRLVISDWKTGCSKQQAIILALISALCRSPPTTSIHFFVTDASAPHFILNHRTPQSLPYVLALTNTLESLLSSSPLLTIIGHWFSRKWVPKGLKKWDKCT